MANNAPIPGDLARTFEALRVALVELTRAVQAARPAGGAAPGGPVGTIGVGAGGEPFAALSGAMGGLTGAVTESIGAFGAITAIASKFVEALSPSATEALGRAFRDFAAVIGTALLPVIETAAAIFRDLGEVLLPLMQQLQPVIAELGTIFKSVLIPVVMLFAQVIQALLPVLQFLLPIVELLANLFRILVALISAVVAAIASALGAAFGKDFQSAADAFRKQLQEMTKAIVVAIGWILKFLGADTALSAFIKALSPPEKTGAEGLAAIQDVQMKGLQDVWKSLNVAAAKASGEAEKAKEDPMVEAVAQLKEIAEMKSDAAMKKLAGILADAFWEKFKNELRGDAYKGGAVGAAEAGAGGTAAVAGLPIPGAPILAGILGGYRATRGWMGSGEEKS
jgi:hypothetical protein